MTQAPSLEQAGRHMHYTTGGTILNGSGPALYDPFGMGYKNGWNLFDVTDSISNTRIL